MESLIDYSRQLEFDRALANIQPNQLNYIIGCGGVGFWLGLILAMQGQQHFVLIDGQYIEKTNLNRLPVPPSWMGVNKAIALRKVMRSLRPVTAIRTITEHIEESTLSLLTEGGAIMNAGSKRLTKIVWDCTDDARIQSKIFKILKTTRTTRGNGGIQYRKLGYEGFQVGSYHEYDVWVPSDYGPGYRTSNACAATSALSAVLGIVTQGLGVSHDVEINIRDIATSVPIPTPEAPPRGFAAMVEEGEDVAIDDIFR